MHFIKLNIDYRPRQIIPDDWHSPPHSAWLSRPSRPYFPMMLHEKRSAFGIYFSNNDSIPCDGMFFPLCTAQTVCRQAETKLLRLRPRLITRGSPYPRGLTEEWASYPLQPNMKSPYYALPSQRGMINSHYRASHAVDVQHPGDFEGGGGNLRGSQPGVPGLLEKRGE
ncbi:hypothetical protein CLAIMM_12903 [Cladophialophora immunda]|nr:hypothetical protein CLAIMM_12903 [Cladophialophora immunda]